MRITITTFYCFFFYNHAGFNEGFNYRLNITSCTFFDNILSFKERSALKFYIARIFLIIVKTEGAKLANFKKKKKNHPPLFSYFLR